MHKPLLTGVFVALGVLAFADIVRACDCERDPTIGRSSSDVVFVGRVVQFQSLAFVEFDVRETFKGRLDRRVRVLTGQSDCDYFLPPLVAARGSDFLLYGTVRDGGLSVSRCTQPGPVRDRARELRELRQPVKK